MTSWGRLDNISLSMSIKNIFRRALGRSSIMLEILKEKRQKHWHLNMTMEHDMTDLFTGCRDIPSCPWIKQSHLGKCSNRKLHTSTLVNDGTLRSAQSTANFVSALSNAKNVKISDLLEFVVMLLFSSLYVHPKIIWRKLQDYENIHRGDPFLIT